MVHTPDARPILGSKPPGLLVSVRSAEEAREAVEGGASIIDVKEPDRGPLGRASLETWRAVRQAVPASMPVSVALGELRDWNYREIASERDIRGIAFRKLGLAGSDLAWPAQWEKIRQLEAGDALWVAVAYADWRSAEAPEPFAVLEEALRVNDCAGVLVDTWDKTKPNPVEVTPEWVRWVDLARRSGRFVALAGGLDAAAIVRLAPIRPDLFAVRGAACEARQRSGRVRRELVSGLVEAIRISY